jgi:hypothetical protein
MRELPVPDERETRDQLAPRLVRVPAQMVKVKLNFSEWPGTFKLYGVNAAEKHADISLQNRRDSSRNMLPP